MFPALNHAAATWLPVLVDLGYHGAYNRRYADSLQRKPFNRAAEAHALVPRSLSAEELGAELPIRGEPVLVKVWVDYGNATVQVLGSAVAWTLRALLVLWTDSHDHRQEAWVWAGAVERVDV